jgi:hypothetical protein
MAKKKTKNTNCLDGMKCPKCGSLEPFHIEVRTMIQYFDEGEDIHGDEEFDKEWAEHSACVCDECQYSGKVEDFRVDRQPRKMDIKALMPIDSTIGNMTRFVELIARMTRDQELQADGNEYDMESDDAIETLNALISKARELDMAKLKPRTHEMQRAFNQVLAALRYWQKSFPSGFTTMGNIRRWSEYFGDEGYQPMTHDEIDKLCECINITVEGESCREPISEEDKYKHMKQVKDGFYCFYHSKLSPGRYCPECETDPPKHWPWMEGVDPEEASHYFGELQECRHCAGTDGRHYAICSYMRSIEDEKTNYFGRDGKVKERL